MLILSRKENEAILMRVPGLPDPIRISVVEMRRGEVRLGCEAPDEVAIIREEIAEKQPRKQLGLGAGRKW